MSFPAVIDNTIRKAFVTCETMAKYRHVDNLRPLDEKMVDLHFGKCFATGVEQARKQFYVQHWDDVYSENCGIQAALAEYGDFIPPAKSNKTREALERSLLYYFEVWPLGADGLMPMEDGIECSFSYPLPLKHPDTGEPLHYAGRYDMRAIDAKHRIHLVDEKTTSKFSDSWLEQWDLDTQLTGYIWAERQRHAIDMTMPEVVGQIRGVSVLRFDNGHVEIPVTRSDWMVQRWYDNLLEEMEQMIARYRAGKWRLALHGNACIQYGRKCDYHMLCLTPNPEQRMEGNYKTVIWSPLART